MYYGLAVRAPERSQKLQELISIGAIPLPHETACEDSDTQRPPVARSRERDTVSRGRDRIHRARHSGAYRRSEKVSDDLTAKTNANILPTIGGKDFPRSRTHINPLVSDSRSAERI